MPDRDAVLKSVSQPQRKCPVPDREVAEHRSCSPQEEAMARRDTQYLNQLFRSHYRQLLRFCRMRVADNEEAEDIVQGAFLAARKAYPEKGIEDLRPLLFTLVRNRAVTYLKSGDHRRKLASIEIGQFADAITCQRTTTPEQQVIDAERLALVEALMAKMPARRRQALLLHRVERLTYAEIASRLSVSNQTVNTDIATAVAELAEGLARADRGRGR